MATDSETVAPPPAKAAERRVPWGAMALVVLGIVGAGGGLGALGGWLWWRWWSPANTGSIYNTTTDGPRWYDLSDQGFSHQFDGPAQYAVVALGLGAVLGVLAAVAGRRQALAALAALVVGSALAAYLSWLVGTQLSPPDPQQYATAANVCKAEPCKEYPAAIEVSGWTPFLCWGIAALGMFALATWIGSWVKTVRRIIDEVEPLPSAKAGPPEQSPQP